MAGLNLIMAMEKRAFMAISGFILIALLLIFDISGRYFTTIEQVVENSQKISKQQWCNNSIWDKHFKISYKGGRELQTEMLRNVTSLSENHCKYHKILVYKCHSSSLCGGWADRQKGIVSTFLMALLTQRIFVIDITSPCKLEEFLQTNVYNWSLCKGFLKSVPSQRKSSLNHIEDRKFIREIRQFDFEGKWNKDVVEMRFNSYAIDGIRLHKQAKSRLNWLLNMSNEEAIHTVLNTLFKPTDVLVDDVVNFYNTQIRGKKLICSHIRKGINPSIPNDSMYSKSSSRSPKETVIFNFLKQYDNTSEYVIYIATDSDEVKRSARSKLASYIYIDRKIVHIDRPGKLQKHKVCEGFYTAIMEQFILSLCDKLLLTHSGFGTFAAYMRGVSDNLYMYHPETKQIVSTNITNIQRVFNFL